jgi:predicted nucleotidyltransferase
MKTIGIIAEFNPFHNGHKYLIERCRQETGADYCIVVMSGDFVQRGAPALLGKFDRAKMALSCGADLVLELPVYYSLGSAEYFASGAISLLDSLGVVDYLCFGSELGDIAPLNEIADILCEESDEFKAVLSKELKEGKSYAKARNLAVLSVIKSTDLPIDDILSSPNNILAIEYLKALRKRNSNIKPFTITRRGEGYHSLDVSETASASAIRNSLFSSGEIDIAKAMPEKAYEILKAYSGKPLTTNDFSELLSYKLTLEKFNGYSKYLDISEELSNKIINNFDPRMSFERLCENVKSKDISYSRISRSLCHILLNITAENMEKYKNDNYTAYARILGFRKASSQLLAHIHECSQIPVLDRLKDADSLLDGLRKRLFEETLKASSVYNQIALNGITSEFSLKNLVL